MGSLPNSRRCRQTMGGGGAWGRGDDCAHSLLKHLPGVLSRRPSAFTREWTSLRSLHRPSMAIAFSYM